MIDFVDASLLIHAGAIMYVIAFLARDELHLRLLALSGSALYISYYFFFPSVPLWDAIFSSSVLIIANLVVLSQLLLERTTFSLSEDEKQLFNAFGTMSPGQFRKVLKLAHWSVADRETQLTRAGEPLDRIFYIVDGSIIVEKSGKAFDLSSENFLGEIAYVLDRPPSATATAPAGTRYVSWNADELRKLSQRNSELGNAMVALLTQDLASKLGRSYQLPDGVEAS